MCIRDRSKFINTIECCINEVYHDAIEVTPYEAQHGRKPNRVWERFIKGNAESKDESVDIHQIFVRIKQKRERHAKRVNETCKLTKFQLGDLVLVRTHYQSDATQRKFEKFCELYAGPFKIKEVLGESTNVLVDCYNENKIRGKFNTRQLKPYYLSLIHI